jgi:hypothetical protein
VNEHGNFSELHLLPVFDVASGAEYSEHDVAILVLLDLRSQMEALRVFDGEIMKAEAVLHVAQLRRVGLEQPEPDEAAALQADPPGTIQPHCALVLAPPITVMGTVDDHGRLLESNCF